VTAAVIPDHRLEDLTMFDLTFRGVADLLFALAFFAVLGALAVGGPVMAVRMARGAFRDPAPRRD
jgi:hypothetical protein